MLLLRGAGLMCRGDRPAGWGSSPAWRGCGRRGGRCPPRPLPPSPLASGFPSPCRAPPSTSTAGPSTSTPCHTHCVTRTVSTAVRPVRGAAHSGQVPHPAAGAGAPPRYSRLRCCARGPGWHDQCPGWHAASRYERAPPERPRWHICVAFVENI
jgi:hypothetical protein